MAKSQATTAAAGIVLDAGDRRKLEGFKRAVQPLANQFSIVREKVADIAPKIRAFYDGLIKKHGADLKWVDFVRLFNPNLPEKPVDYRRDKMFYTLNYIKQTWQRAEQLEKRKAQGGGQGAVNPATARLEAVLKFALLLIEPADHPVVWQAVKARFEMKDRGLKQLQNRVASADYKPLLDVHPAKLAHVTESNIVQMPTAEGSIPALHAALSSVQGRKAAGRKAAA